jgi:ATP-dependent Clp protease adaptor protein ClpS
MADMARAGSWLENVEQANIMVRGRFDHWVRQYAEEAVSDESATATVPLEEIAARPRERTEEATKRQPPYNVVLWNDDDHTYQYVILMLQSVFAYPPEKGYVMAKKVDTQGRVIVLTTTMEHAELKRDQIHAYGKDDLVAECKGSMKATIEAAE